MMPACLVRVCAHGCGLLQSCRSSLAELMARTSLDLELDLQASKTRQRQLNEEICTLRELRQRLEDAQLRGQTDLPHWVLRDERFRSLLKEAERQVSGQAPHGHCGARGLGSKAFRGSNPHGSRPALVLRLGLSGQRGALGPTSVRRDPEELL